VSDGGAHAWAETSGTTCRDAHRLRRACSEIRHLTSEADIFDNRRRRHSISTEFMVLSCSNLLQA
jgi:hypothetical protein